MRDVEIAHSLRLCLPLTGARGKGTALMSAPILNSPSFLALKDPATLPAALSKPVVALGNFDGLHRGHREVMTAALALAQTLARPATMLTFDPHPRAFFAPEKAPARLTPAPVKDRLCAELGLSGSITLPFDNNLAALTPEAFIDTMLVQRFAVAGVAVGHDFRFGKARAGSPETIVAAGKAHGFDVRVVPALADGDDIISSSGIRQALSKGDIRRANRMLGYDFRLAGAIIHGQKLGRTIGYPTANIALPEDCPLPHGIYAVRTRIDGVWLDGVASFGRRPTFDNGAPLFEIFIFDFDGDLYGKMVDVAVVARLRDEMKFDGIAPLLAQMDKDSAEARTILKASI
jgi:riboflavin kinase / FMN adenylyltransferase